MTGAIPAIGEVEGAGSTAATVTGVTAGAAGAGTGTGSDEVTGASRTAVGAGTIGAAVFKGTTGATGATGLTVGVAGAAGGATGATGAATGATTGGATAAGRNSQILWIEGRQATSDTGVSGDGSGVMSTGRSRSLPWWNTAPARTNATRCGALTARHRDCAASISL
ncbi:Uncharacterised protein [Mycobacteroides abscessus subsp. abscessus]|nr:Uncharacterised protein [Mycobacteroides abscessus subsp. abscessus]SKR80130.1 Uncharacterised protein [Mycobacteroides abscessus subsp. abscessus]